MRRISGIFLIILILAMIVGCEKKETKDEEPVSAVEDKKEIAKEETAKEKLEIEIPDSEDLVTDYTSVTGLPLKRGTHIAVVVKNPKLNYWKAVEKGMNQAIADLNQQLGYAKEDKIYLTYEGPDSDKDAEVQINTIDAVLAENPQVLCLSAIDMNSCQAQLETAQENGIPVIILDSGVKSDELVYTVCETDNYNAGIEAAQKLCEKIGDFGKIQIVAHEQNAETSVKREKGFRDEVLKNHPNIEMLDTIYDGAGEDIETVLMQVLDMNPDLKGCFTTSEDIGVKTLELLNQQKVENIQLVGFDSGDKQIQAIRDGKEYGVICQNPYGMGYATVVAAARAVLGRENDEYINAGYQWIDINNIDNEENLKYLYG